jgi:hypothetical protein
MDMLSRERWKIRFYEEMKRFSKTLFEWNLFSFEQAFRISMIISSQTRTNGLRKLKIVPVMEFHHILSFFWRQFRTSNRKILRKKFDFSYSGVINNIFFSMNQLIFFCHFIENLWIYRVLRHLARESRIVTSRQSSNSGHDIC